MLETALGAISAPTRFSLVRISVRDLVADGKSLVRNSGVACGVQNRILINRELELRWLIANNLRSRLVVHQGSVGHGLRGTLPRGLAKASSLDTLVISHQQLTGIIPPVVATLKMLCVENNGFRVLSLVVLLTNSAGH